MPSTDAQSMYTAGRCYACFGMSEAEIVEMGLMVTILQTLAPTVDTSPAALNRQINCYTCFAPGSMAQMYRLALLSLIAQNIGSSGGGGGGGNGQMVLYTAFPPANPPNTALPAIAYDPTGALGNLNWNPATLSWN